MVCRSLGKDRRNPANCGKKSHIQHAIRFIEHQRLQCAELNEPPIEKILQSARSGDDDARSLADGGQLLALRTNRPPRGPPAASCLPRRTLYCSTTCMANSRVGTSTSAAIPALSFSEEFFDHRNQEREGLAGSGLSGREHILALDAPPGWPQPARASVCRNAPLPISPSYRRRGVILKNFAFCFLAGGTDEIVHTDFRARDSVTGQSFLRLR